MRYKQNPWIKQLAWLLDGTTASISLLLDSDTDRHGFDQHTDEELRKIVEEAARAAQAVTEGAKPAWLVVVVVGTAARQRRLLPGCRCQSTQASYSSTAEDAILTSEAFPGCKFAKSVVNPLSLLMDCSSTHVGPWLSEYVDTLLDSIDKMERLPRWP